MNDANMLSIASLVTIVIVTVVAAVVAIIYIITMRQGQRNRQALESPSSASTALLAAFTSAMDDRLALGSSARKIGLQMVILDSTTFDYNPVLSAPGEVSIVLNDGRTWLSFHRDRLRRRLADPTKRTSIYLVHPDSAMVSVLARKGSVDEDVIRAKIHESVKLVDELREEGGHVEVLGHFLFNPFSLVMTPDTAVVTPYFLSRGGRTVPSYVYINEEGSGLYSKLAADLEGLRKDCEALLLSRSSLPAQYAIRKQPVSLA